MERPVQFSKLSGSGNDFICIDNRDGRFDAMLDRPSRAGHFARLLCRRGLSVGADGLIFACRPEIEGVADIAARFYEPDGSETELCGNGTACFVHWAQAGGLVNDGEVKILTQAGIVRGRPCEGRYVRVCIPLPEDMRHGLELDLGDRKCRCDFAVTGVPHAIVYVDDVEKADVARLGRAVRHHEVFAPRGANANFVQVLGEGRIAMRTFEFGVEGETLACGTGSAAAAILTAVRHNWPAKYLRGEEPVLVQARSGDVLRVYFTLEDDGRVSDLCLESVVRFVYQGQLSPDLAAEATRPKEQD